MNKIISKEHFSEKVIKLVIEAPLIAKSRKAGHFVIVRVGEKGERMPLTIAEADPVKGTITLVVQEVGLSSTRLCELNEGDYITDVVGPLGKATHIENFGTVVCAGGGVGVAPMLPIVQALKAAGNRVITVLAGRSKELIILEKEMRESSDEVIIMTDDGSYGNKGLVTEGVEQVIKREKVDKCFAIGPAVMMKFVCLLTQKYQIPTDVSLNTIMVDGTGMCGACRITVGGKTKFVCVDGSGPAGLSFAGDMAKLGYDVTVFEALHEIGGVLKYGIPEFRLPNKIVDVEIENLSKMGVQFVKDCIIGKTISVEDLEAEGYKGVFVASGAGLPNFMNIPGENSINIMSSNEYLTRVNLMDAASEDSDTPVTFGKRVAVIGGGNTAMDSVRTARRLGAEKAMIIYRRSEAEMPARVEEVKHAKEEGVEFLTLHNPIEYIADERGRVKQIVLQKMELGEPDASGRRSPVAIPGATETIDIDMAIVSVGVSPNPIVPNSIPGLELGRKGTIAVNDDMQSSIPTIYAGGDIVRGGATVILAMGDGRRAAAAMHKQLKG